MVRNSVAIYNMHFTYIISFLLLECFIYLLDGETEIELPSAGLLPRCSVARAGPGWSWESGAQYRSSLWVARNQLLEPSQSAHYQKAEIGTQALWRDAGVPNNLLTTGPNDHLSLQL